LEEVEMVEGFFGTEDEAIPISEYPTTNQTSFMEEGGREGGKEEGGKEGGWVGGGPEADFTNDENIACPRVSCIQ